GVNTPPIVRAVMRSVSNPVEDGVPHPDVRRLHIDLCAQRAKTVGKLARPHLLKEAEIFLRRAFTKWTLFSDDAVAVSVLWREVVHVSLAFGDKLACVFEDLFEIVRGVKWLGFARGLRLGDCRI